MHCTDYHRLFPSNGQVGDTEGGKYERIIHPLARVDVTLTRVSQVRPVSQRGGPRSIPG